MTDKQIIETLRNIKTHCRRMGICNIGGCKFYLEKEVLNTNCRLVALAKCFGRSTPNIWEMDVIERIINDVD